jgi:hypothetical protein
MERRALNIVEFRVMFTTAVVLSFLLLRLFILSDLCSLSPHISATFTVTVVVQRYFRARRVLENKQNLDDDRIENLARQLKESQVIAGEAEKKYEEVYLFTCVNHSFVNYRFSLLLCCVIASSTPGTTS